MTRPLLVLRPEPGNAATCARAEAIGLEAITCPLFTVEACPWDAPDAADFDGLLVTSANALRHGGQGLAAFRQLPLYAVGAATAAAAKQSGFAKIVAGEGDVAGLVATIATQGVQRLLHLAGEDRTDFDAPGIHVVTRIAYRSVALPEPAGLAEAIARAPFALVHSARAGARFAGLVQDRANLVLIAISAAAAATAGPGWEEVAIPDEPRDEAMLALAAARVRHDQGFQ